MVHPDHMVVFDPFAQKGCLVLENRTKRNGITLPVGRTTPQEKARDAIVESHVDGVFDLPAGQMFEETHFLIR